MTAEQPKCCCKKPNFARTPKGVRCARCGGTKPESFFRRWERVIKDKR